MTGCTVGLAGFGSRRNYYFFQTLRLQSQLGMTGCTSGLAGFGSRRNYYFFQTLRLQSELGMTGSAVFVGICTGPEFVTSRTTGQMAHCHMTSDGWTDVCCASRLGVCCASQLGPRKAGGERPLPGSCFTDTVFYIKHRRFM